VVDLGKRRAITAGDAPVSLNFGLDGAFATYVGWLIPSGTPVTLLGDTPENVAEAQRELVRIRIRIGIDRPAAQATGGHETWTDGELWVALRQRLPRFDRRSILDAPRRDLVAIDDSFDNAEKVGLHLVGRGA
jgi:hydroxyacylglutathione hydrolase